MAVISPRRNCTVTSTLGDTILGHDYADPNFNLSVMFFGYVTLTFEIYPWVKALIYTPLDHGPGPGGGGGGGIYGPGKI